jgi:hypothetical protein
MPTPVIASDRWVRDVLPKFSDAVLPSQARPLFVLRVNIYSYLQR